MSPQLAGQISAYRPRMADQELALRLKATGAVLIEGARACGKTQTALQQAGSAVRLDSDLPAREAALLDPSLLLDGERPRVIDEWQLVPEVWNQVRVWVNDHPDEPGAFVLTGSALPADDAMRNVGALRFSRLRMRPMSLHESGHSTGAVSLRAMFGGAAARATAPSFDIRALAERIAIGGWPGLIDRPVEAAQLALRGYLDDTARVDLQRIDEATRDPENVGRVLRSLARHTATEGSARSLAADIGGEDGPIKYQTVIEYARALARVFVVEDQPAWSPSLRSRSVLRRAPRRHFVDPSLAAAALRATPARLLQDPEMLGQLCESLVVRDLRIYSALLDGTVHHYRDNTGLEVDAIVALGDGRWASFEVKLGQHEIDDAAETLLRFVQRVDTKRHGPPSFLGVITGWGYAYRRPDGVNVIPIATLAP